MSLSNPIFIVGASRSGTTMLASMLGRHSALHDIGETHFFGDLCEASQLSSLLPTSKAIQIGANLYARLRKGIWQGFPQSEDLCKAKELFQNGSEVPLKQVFLTIALDFAKRANKQRPIEQTPRNIYYVRELLMAYPDAHIIEIVRDPRAVLCSQRYRWRIRLLGASNMPWREVLRVFINYHAITMSLLWRKAVHIGQAHISNCGNYRRIRYEDMVQHPKEKVMELCEFLGIDFEKDMLDVPYVASSISFYTEGKTGISKASMGSWRGKLPKGDWIICDWITGCDARMLGYLSQRRGLLHPAVFLHLLRYPFHLIGSFLVNPSRIFIQAKGLLLRS